jgi:hypothetical protein
MERDDGSAPGSLPVIWRLIVDEAAEAEILEAAGWYRSQSPSLHGSFLNAVGASLAAIELNPLQYQLVSNVVRRAMVAGFPCALLYSVEDEHVVVTVCIHMHRDPKVWQSRFSE